MFKTDEQRSFLMDMCVCVCVCVCVCEYTYAHICVLDLISDNPKLLNTLSTFHSFPTAPTFSRQNVRNEFPVSITAKVKM